MDHHRFQTSSIPGNSPFGIADPSFRPSSERFTPPPISGYFPFPRLHPTSRDILMNLQRIYNIEKQFFSFFFIIFPEEIPGRCPLSSPGPFLRAFTPLFTAKRAFLPRGRVSMGYTDFPLVNIRAGNLCPRRGIDTLTGAPGQASCKDQHPPKAARQAQS